MSSGQFHDRPGGLFIVVSCAATIHVNGIKVDSAKEAALALAPLAGTGPPSLFALGLLNASLFSASILPLSTAYFICEAFGIEAGIDKSWGEAPAFYWLYTILIIVGAGFILIPNIPLIMVMFWSQVLNGVMLPFVLIFMLMLINNKDIMGDHVNTRTYNIISWITVVIMVALTLLMVVTPSSSRRIIIPRLVNPASRRGVRAGFKPAPTFSLSMAAPDL